MPERLLIDCPAGPYGPERQYAFEVVIREFLGLECLVRTGPHAATRISLEGDASGRALYVADGLFQTPEAEWLTPSSLPSAPLATWHAPGYEPFSPLPMLYGRAGDAPLRHEQREAWLSLDVFGGVFFLLTRYEELVAPVHDVHERFLSSASLAARAGYLERPLANEYVEVLWKALQTLWPGLKRRRRRYRVVLSHDVDKPLSAPGEGLPRVALSAGGDLWRRHDPVLAARRLAAWPASRLGIHWGDPYDTFDYVMAMSEHFGLQSAFYFLADRTDPRLDGNYSLEEPWIERLIRRVKLRRHEIGLHPSYHSFRNPAQLRREADHLRRRAASLGIEQARWGGRQHFLRWENPSTWQAWDDAGLDYDASVAFADRIGFRAGCCYEYPVFNLLTRRILALRERPLLMMDQTLLAYMGLRGEHALKAIATLARACRQVRGDFTMLWHNNVLAVSSHRRLYERVLAEIGH